MDKFLSGMLTGAIACLGMYLGGKVADSMCKLDEENQ